MEIWYLEGFTGPRGAIQRLRLAQFPFRIGRQEDLELSLDSGGISRLHAEINVTAEGLTLTDLDSTNGTFLNREQMRGTLPIQHGDIIHFADEEFRLLAERKATRRELKQTQQGILDLSERMPAGSREFQALLLNSEVTAVFQPIVAVHDHEHHAFEILGRGTSPDLSESPVELFRIAESLGMEVYLSQVFRQVGLELANTLQPDARYFINIHPAEVDDAENLYEHLEAVRRRFTDLDLVLEVHEKTVAAHDVLSQLLDKLKALNIKVAYDDFGVGQSRLVELADFPPDYVKIDMALIRDIDRAPAAKQDMVRMLVEISKRYDIQVIAEGVATDAEADFCTAAGVDLLQGFRFGRPGPINQ